MNTLGRSASHRKDARNDTRCVAQSYRGALVHEFEITLEIQANNINKFCTKNANISEQFALDRLADDSYYETTALLIMSFRFTLFSLFIVAEQTLCGAACAVSFDLSHLHPQLLELML